VPLLIHDERLSRRVGAMVLVVTALVVLFVALVKDRLGGGGVRVRVYFAGSTGLREGAAVRIAGRTVGEVTAISIVPVRRTWKGHPLEGTGGVVATMQLDPGWARRIPSNAEVFVGARSVLAPRYLELGPPRAALPARPFAAGDEVRGVDPPDLDRILQRMWDNLGDIEEFIAAIRPSSQALTMAIARLVWALDRMAPGGAGDAARAAVDEAMALLAELEAGGVEPAALPRLAGRARRVLARAEVAIAELRDRAAAFLAAVDRAGAAIPPGLRRKVDRAAAAFTAALRRADALTAQLGDLLDEASAGTGTLAAFARDLELFDDLKEMVKGMKRAPWRFVPPASAATDRF
jgi:ABC-type transporter Mla subunit MlaD